MTKLHSLIALGLISQAVGTTSAQADNFLQRGSARLDFHNYYFDREFQDSKLPGYKRELREWAQGITFLYQSGYTEGPIGFGFDVRTLTGIKLDSSLDRAGSGLLPRDSTGRSEDEYSTLGVTAKARLSNTDLAAGMLILNLPLALSSPARLLPQTFNGVYLRSQDFEHLDLHLGYLDRIKYRDSSNNQKITVVTANGRFRSAESSGMTFAGADYKPTDALTLSLHHAVLNDIYQQQYLGLVHDWKLGAGILKTDLRLQFSEEDGAARGGPVDNQNLGVVFRYSLGGHRFSAGYMQLLGDTAQPYMGQSEPSPVVEGAMSTDFLNAKERTWQIRHDYNYAALGIPGLTSTLWHMRGNNADLPASMGGNDRSERETQAAVTYTVQSGPLKDVSVRLRHAWHRNTFGPAATFRDNNEFRVNLYYTWKLW